MSEEPSSYAVAEARVLLRKHKLAARKDLVSEIAGLLDRERFLGEGAGRFENQGKIEQLKKDLAQARADADAMKAQARTYHATATEQSAKADKLVSAVRDISLAVNYKRFRDLHTPHVETLIAEINMMVSRNDELERLQRGIGKALIRSVVGSDL